MKRNNTKLFWIAVLIAILACVGNMLFAIFSKSDLTTNVLTAISGWISGVATLIIGIIAFLQSKKYQEMAEQKEKNIDVIVESVWIDNINMPLGQLSRQCLFKDVKMFSGKAFYLRIFNYTDKPIFDIRTNFLMIGDKKFEYNDIQPIYKDANGRSFLTNDNSFVLLASIPQNELNDNDYSIVIQMKNQYGEQFIKELSFKYARNSLPHCYGLKQQKSYKAE